MKDILEWICGHHVEERPQIRTKEWDKALEKEAAAYNLLTSRLTKEDKELLDKFIYELDASWTYESESFYKLGFKMGFQLANELFAKE